MAKLRLLALTQHTVHGEENSIYPLLRDLLKHSRCEEIDVASRGLKENFLFFEKQAVKSLIASPVTNNFFFYPDGRCFEKNLKRIRISDYDAVLLRLPHPVSDSFWHFLASQYPSMLFINDPLGIEATGTKAFLLNFPELCPPMKHCTQLTEIEELRSKYPIVLKPAKSYGGKGIIRISGNSVSLAEGGTLTFGKWAKLNTGKQLDYIAVPFLKNVVMGDKRIVVCCSQILGASLRKPRPGNWVCNISQGGSSSGAEADEIELEMIRQINPVLEGFGIVFYGIDTLVNDDGKRVLSEINTLSIGGLPKIEEFSKRPVIKTAAKLLWDYIIKSSGN